MSQFVAALRKDLLLQWRTRAQLVAVFVFGASALLLFSFAIGPNAAALRAVRRPASCGSRLLLASTLTLAESFQSEMEQRALEGLLLLPADPRALYYGKALANWLQLTLLGVALVPVMVVLYDAGTARVLALLGIIVLGAAGLSAPGTLYAAMTAQVRARSTLLPLLLFPLVVPVLLAAVKATSLLILGDPMGQLGAWTMLLVAFDAIYWSLCGLAVRARGRGLRRRDGQGSLRPLRASAGFGHGPSRSGARPGASLFAPREAYMGDVQRIMYVHVPTAWNAMLVLTFAFVCALVFLLRGGWKWDARLEAAIEVGRRALGARSACRGRSGPSRPGACGGTGTRGSPPPR